MPTSSSSQVRRTASTRSTSRTSKTTVDDLANRLQSKLTMSYESRKKGRTDANAASSNPEDLRLTAMRAVDAASQKLSVVLQSGWRASAPIKPSRSRKDVDQDPQALWETARTSLQRLRSFDKGEEDIERAALSITSKLVALEMYSAAKDSLMDMHPTMWRWACGEAPQTSGIDLCHLHVPPTLSADLTSSNHKLGTITSYLLYANIARVYTLLAATQDEDPNLEAEILPMTLDLCLLKWIALASPHLPPHQATSLLTKVYTAVMRATSGHSQTHPRSIFALRAYALLHLARAGAQTTTPDSFWDQAVRTAKSLLQNVGSAKGEVLKSALEAFSSVERAARDQGLAQGRGYASWCEYGTELANRVGDLSELGRIAASMKALSISERFTSASARDAPVGDPSSTLGVVSSGSRSQEGVDQFMVASSKVVVALSQAIAIFEKPETDDAGIRKAVADVAGPVSECRPFLTLPTCKNDEDGASSQAQDMERACFKVRRALDKLRRAAIKLVDRGDEKGSSVKEEVLGFLEKMIELLESTAKKNPSEDLVTPAIDTLFLLARIRLVPQRTSTIALSFELLSRALRLIGVTPSPNDVTPQPDDLSINEMETTFGEERAANYLRCISGAYHNLACVLYQAGMHAYAIRFLVEGCRFGLKATRAHEDASRAKTPLMWKHEDAWVQLRGQLYRRWELLGACYSKIGDTKAAYNAYVHAITTYPFLEPPFLDLVESGNITKAFEASPASRQIGNIIDRVTYMATQDMFREPEDVPLTSAFEHAWPNGVESRFNLVIAAVLERQAESLIASRWKENVSIAILALLEAALAIYTPEKWPYRRARLLLKILETTYHTSAEPVRRRGRDFQQIGEEIQKLIAHSDIGCDDVIRMYGDEYIVSAHLWISLHYHREQRVTDCLQSAQSAWDVSKRKFLHLSQRTPAKSMAAKGLSSPKRARAAPKGRTTTIKKGALPRPSIRPVVSARSKQSRTTTSRIKAKDPVTPKPRHVFEAPSRSPVTPPRKADAAVSTMVLDNPEKLLTLFDTTCQLIGLIGHISLRIRLLSVARRICESSLDSHIERFVKVSTELARNYATLGKSYKAALIFQQGADVISRFQTRVSTDVRLLFLLHHAATLALMDDIHTSAKLYCEAVALSSATKDEERGVSTSDRVRSRARRLVRTATASDVYAIIQSARAEPAESLSAMLRSLRLWNRAVEALSRLAPRPNVAQDDNPFDTGESQTEDPSPGFFINQPVKDHNASRVSVIDGSEWAISEGLLLAMFSVSRMYLVRGSAREAQYFAQQTEELAMSLSAYAMIARALAGQAEIQLHLRQLEDAKNLISRAAAMVEDLPGIEAADIYRLHGDYNRLSARREDAHKLYTEATATLDGLAMSFSVIDALVTSQRRPSTATVTKAEDSSFETLAPRLLSTILWQQIWLLRENVNDENYRVLLDRLLALPSSTDVKAEQNSLIAKLTLHDIFSRFRSDIYLSTLGETAIAIPMGMLSDKGTSPPASLQEVLGIFAGAEQLWWANLASTAMKGEVLRVRDGALSLASVQALQASLGQNPETGPIVAMRLLDIAASLTIRREMLEATRHKISELEAGDDLAWSLMTPNGSPLGPARNSTPKPSWDSDSEEDEDSNAEADGLSVYWKGIYGKYQQLPMDVSSLSSSQAEQLPDNWVVVNINLAEDRDTLYISRQRKGKDSLMFCLPLKGRRDSDEENHLTLDGAVAEMKDIVKLNDEGTRSAATVDVKDKQARVAWWAGRTELDQRLRDLLENIEFCWLGAFKTILSPAIAVNGGALAHFREGLEKVLKRGLNLRNKKEMSRLRLSDGLLECFSNLSPQCRDEELEDLVYFMLDLYQFHGVAVAVSEIDVDQVAVDLRSVLEEHAKRSGSPTTNNDSHLFLVLDKDLQGIPWESIPVLRGKSVSRIPCMEFLLDRLQFEDWQRSSVTGSSPKPNNKAADRATVDPRRTYYLLNPSGDLKGTQSRFSDWLETMRSVGWQGITGRPPSEQQFLDALNRKDLVIYFGHGGAEQYVRSHKVRHLSRCAATLLWGCSSGALKEMGDFDRVGTPYNYMVSGCPTLVANLWDVTDRDIDKFSQAVFDKLRLDPDHVKNWDGAEGGKVSLMEAVAKSRDVCKLKYLNGAAPVVYGIPFYL